MWIRIIYSSCKPVILVLVVVLPTSPGRLKLREATSGRPSSIWAWTAADTNIVVHISPIGPIGPIRATLYRCCREVTVTKAARPKTRTKRRRLRAP